MSLSPPFSADPTSSDDHPISDDSPISTLLQSEFLHMPNSDYVHRFRDRTIDLTARQDSIHWIFKVHAHYNFKPLTSFLSVNYFDRFLSSRSLPERSGWAYQLLSVACLSLAAKMEESDVPLLLDLQIFDPKFVFEPTTVQRMELCVMSNLDWRLRAVTPFDFLHHFISILPSSAAADGDASARLLSDSSDLILSTTRVIDFLGFPPSATAAAAVLCAAGESLDSPGVCSYFLAANGEMVRSCHQLMEEYVIDTCLAGLRKEQSGGAEPPSPVGVLDAAASGSCDYETRLGNPDAASHQDEPPTKRLRSSVPDVQEQ